MIEVYSTSGETHLGHNGRATRDLGTIECDACGGRMRIVAAIQRTDALQRVLGHLGLPCEAPKLRPARAPPEQTELLLWADD